MTIKTFRAQSLEEALARVKATVGPSALIIETRKVAPRGPFGFLRKPIYEVVVGIEDDPRAARPRRLAGPTDWATELADLRNVEGEIREIKQALKTLTNAAPHEVGTPAADLARRLIGHGIDQPAAMALAAEALAEPGADATQKLLPALARRFRVAPEPEPQPGTPRILILAGPSGAGKTTLLAKLAGRFILGHGHRVALAGADFFRVGALEQLKAYADILGASFTPVEGPEAAAEAIQGARGAQWLLIDTPGLAVADTRRLERLAAWLQAFPNAQRHLVLSATTDAHAARAAVDAYRQVGFDHLAFTKLDEPRRGGLLLAAAQAADVPVAYLGSGQDVAEGLDLARPDRLARLVLGDAAPRQGTATPAARTGSSQATRRNG